MVVVLVDVDVDNDAFVEMDNVDNDAVVEMDNVDNDAVVEMDIDVDEDKDELKFVLNVVVELTEV